MIYIYNFINDENSNTEYNNEFSLHLETDYVIIRPQSILKGIQMADIVNHI